jgi:AraC-like DNA-binding protein
MPLERQSTPSSIPPGERTEQWSAIIADAYFPLALDYRDPTRFQGLLERRRAGPVGLSRLRSEPAQYTRLPGQIRPGEPEEYLVTLPALTPVLFRQMGRDVSCAPGGFILERGDEPYRFAYEGANDLLVMKVARAALADRLRQPDRLCATGFDAREGLGGLFAETMRRVHALPDEGGALEVIGRQLVELLALALDRQAETTAGAATAIRAAHLARAQDAIRRRLGDPGLSPDAVANACGISKRYLHELFSDTETTVAGYIREARLAAARELLELPGELSLAEVAYRFGFSDQAQFSRLFRARYGQSPSGWRSAFHAARG